MHWASLAAVKVYMFDSKNKCTFQGEVTFKLHHCGRFHSRFFLLQKHACKHSSQCWEINCCGWLIAERFKPFTLPQRLTLAGVASVCFITELPCGPGQMWNIPISEGRVALLRMFKVFQCESIYCLRERTALAVLESEL